MQAVDWLPALVTQAAQRGLFTKTLPNPDWLYATLRAQRVTICQRFEVVKPFAIELYEQYLSGKTVEQLALENDIPRDRVELRLRAATNLIQSAGHVPEPANSGK